MGHLKPRTELATHEVVNQAPPLEDVNCYETDIALKEAVSRNGAAWMDAELGRLGARVGSAEVQDWAARANASPPVLKAFDRYGRRIDEADFHPDYHRLMALGLESGVSAVAWTAEQSGHVAHSALMYVLSQADQGVCCPFSMTYACIPTLRHQPDLAAEWEPRVTAAAYDPRCIPADEKRGVTLGMAMTEKQGGSDVRANTTRAVPIGVAGEYELVGHKWFCSAPMSDGFLTLAKTEGGLSCFFVPKWRPDGTRNTVQVVRLKDKLGDRSNASSEIEYHNAWARMVGEEGRGVRTIIEMVQGTRLDCMVGSTAIMRAALSHALWHAEHRRAFGPRLVEHPAMAQVLADLALEQEAALAMSFRVARAFDDAPRSEHAAAIARILTPIAKYWICKRTPSLVYEAMECLGGAGYVEESPVPRYFRQSPLNSIWEGSGNVIALDTLRAIQREPGVLEALFAELDEARGADRYLDGLIHTVTTLNVREALDDTTARHFVELLALAFQGAVLVREAPPMVAEGFAATRLRSERGFTWGAFAPGLELDARGLIERASPLSA
ncbi:MAG: DNA alkylation response protein [Gammaproteobacteria bacterium]|jgi:putative acyl-CoA dehydrogenase|nr:DNA alkylation response protein [Gammaproteobacteria bacterium]